MVSRPPENAYLLICRKSNASMMDYQKNQVHSTHESLGLCDSTNIVSAATLHPGHTWCSTQRIFHESKLYMCWCKFQYGQGTIKRSFFYALWEQGGEAGWIGDHTKQYGSNISEARLCMLKQKERNAQTDTILDGGRGRKRSYGPVIVNSLSLNTHCVFTPLV